MIMEDLFITQDYQKNIYQIEINHRGLLYLYS
jgi:hypothetical protein